MLVTFCPKCHTSFYITQNQIEHAKGHVKCGQCGTLFNAHDHLEPTSIEEVDQGDHSFSTQNQSAKNFFSGRSSLSDQTNRPQNLNKYLPEPTTPHQHSKAEMLEEMPFSLAIDVEDKLSSSLNKTNTEDETSPQPATFFSKDDPFELSQQDREKEKQLNLSIEKLRQYANLNAEKKEEVQSKWGIYTVGSIIATFFLLLQLLVFNWPQPSQADPIQLLSSSLQKNGNHMILNIEAQIGQNQTQLPTLYVTLQDEQEKTIINKAIFAEQYLKYSKNDKNKLSIELNMTSNHPISVGSHEVFWQ